MVDRSNLSRSLGEASGTTGGVSGPLEGDKGR